ncbi:cytokine receptor-like isoform X2 [Ochlerotatus camptorhynchus]
MKTIPVARPPPAIKPSDFKCISHNRKFLTCEFKRQNSCRFPTNYKLSMNRLGLLNDCELNDNVSMLSFDSRSETCMFSAGHKNISFLVDSENIVGKTETTIIVNHYDIVRPSAPTSLQVPFVNSTSIQATWDLSIMLLNLDREIEFEFLMISKYGNNTSFKNMTFEKGVPMVHQFNDLHAFTSYELKIRARVVPKSVRNYEDEYWSDGSSVRIRTKACRPYQAPRTAPGTYRFKERSNKLATVEVYWELVPEYLHNGPGFGYDVFAVSESGQRFNASHPVNPNGVATFQNIKANERYTVHLSSYNHEGRSENVSLIPIYPPKVSYDPKIKRILFNDSYHLQWFSGGEPEHLSNYTVMHCIFSATGSCQNSIHIVTLPPNATSYSINSTKPLNFALAANYRSYSSELSWMQCIVPTPSNISRLTFNLTDVTEHSVTLRISLSCTDQSLVERYEVRYWPKMDKSLEKNMTKRPYDLVIKIDDLMKDTEYMVNVTAFDEHGIPHTDSYSVRTSERDILLQLIMFLLFGILAMAIMTTTATRRVKKMMNIKFDIPLGLLGIDEMPMDSSQRIYAGDEIESTVLFSESLENDKLMPLAPFDLDDAVQSVKVKSILKKPDETVHDKHSCLSELLEKQKATVQIVTGTDYVQPLQMLSIKDQAKQDLPGSENRSSGSSGYVDVNLMMKQQMIR